MQQQMALGILLEQGVWDEAHNSLCVSAWVAARPS